jgi:hypothetical protein
MRLDLDTARIAIGLREGGCLRVWAAGVEANRGTGQQWLSRNQMHRVLSQHGITYSRRYIHSLLERGDGLFWTLSEDRVYFTGQVRLAARLTQQAIDSGRVALVASHRPGGAAQDVSPSGSLGQFEARVFAAWIDGKMLANQTLETLWNRTRPQLYHWRNLTHLSRERNFGQTHHIEDRRIPDTAYTTWIRVDGRRERGVRWRRPNTYHNPVPAREHAHRGQGYKIRRAVNAVLSAVETLVSCVESYPSRCQYWVDPRTLKRSLRTVARHPWHSDYTYRQTSRDGRSIWELMPPGQWCPVTGLRIEE